MLRCSYQESQGRKFLISERRLWPLVRSWQGLFKSSCLQNGQPVDSEIDVGLQWLAKSLIKTTVFDELQNCLVIDIYHRVSQNPPKKVPDRNQDDLQGHFSSNFKSEQVVVVAANRRWSGLSVHVSLPTPIWNWKGVPAGHLGFYVGTPCSQMCNLASEVIVRAECS